MTFAKSNLNDYIKVKLTEYGRKIYRSSFTSLGLSEPNINVDEEGYTRFQMHDFINTFGKYIYMGCEMPCETTIQIQIDSVMKEKNAQEQLIKAREIILKLYNAGRDVLMCRAEEKAYDNLSNAINDRSIEQFLKEIE